jgi:CubicO group peptidase (beta-lactamase class C family)
MANPARPGIGALFIAWLIGLCLTAPLQAEVDHYGLPGGAAEYNDPYIAAGFRALFTCSAHFLMGRSLQDIVLVELADTRALELPDPEIDQDRHLVRAADGRGNVVVAAHRNTMGCTVLPPNWTEADLPHLPYVSRPLPENDPGVDYPAGDKANPAPSQEQRSWIDTAFDGQSYGDNTLTTGVLIIRDGKIVAEHYRPGFSKHQGYRTWSTAKSISASLIGIAAGRALLDLEAPAAIPEWQGPADPRSRITWQQLMWMSSGLWSEGSNTNAVYFAGQDAVSSATTTPLEAEPGTRWKYANNDTLLLLRGLRHVLADDLVYLRFPYDALLHRIGMYHTWMETDHLGNFIGSSQVYTTTRDLGRFALLYLNDGVSNGQRILPEGWTDFVATPAPALTTNGGNRGYGAQFWLLGGIEGMPEGTYTTSGNKGQHATIIPEANMVVVRTGVDPLGHRWNHPAFVIDALAAFGR